MGVECASASSSSSAAIAAAEQQQQQLAASAADCDISADAEELSDRCKQILQAALHVPGVADSYRAAAHSRGIAALSAASPKYQQQQQGALVPDSTGLPPAPNRRRIRGLAKLLGKVDEDAAAPVHAPGVITLSAGVLFGHSANVTLRGTEPMSEEESASACPTIQGVACSGRGSCEAGTDSCVCEAGSLAPRASMPRRARPDAARTARARASATACVPPAGRATRAARLSATATAQGVARALAGRARAMRDSSARRAACTRRRRAQTRAMATATVRAPRSSFYYRPPPSLLAHPAPFFHPLFSQAPSSATPSPSASATPSTLASRACRPRPAANRSKAATPMAFARATR